jgi:hypothetical protein
MPATKQAIANAARSLFPGVKLQVVREAHLTESDTYVVESNDGQVLAGPCYHLDDLYAQVKR